MNMQLLKYENKLLKQNNKYIRDISNLYSEIIITDANLDMKKTQLPHESMNWLKVAESAFKFWDNETDDVWNDV